jgi:hypothetical protein
LPVLQRAERHACAEQLGEDVAYHNPRLELAHHPVGVLVTSIPDGAATVTVNGANYREFGGIWYRPFYSGSDVVYQTVPNPTG